MEFNSGFKGLILFVPSVTIQVVVSLRVSDKDIPCNFHDPIMTTSPSHLSILFWWA